MNARQAIAAFVIALTVAFGALALPAAAEPQQAPPPEVPPEVPAKVKELIDLLKDPTVAEWLAKQAAAKPAEPGRHFPNLHEVVTGWYESARNQLLNVQIAFTQKIPLESRNATMAVAEELQAYGLTRAWPLVMAFLALGIGSLFVAIWLTRGAYDRYTRMPIASVADRLEAIRGRAVVLLVRVLAFFAGSVGVFLLFEWPPLVKSTVAAALIAAQGLSVGVAIAALLLAPSNPAHPDAAAVRILPVSDAAARFWFGKLAALTGLLSLGLMVGGAMKRLGFTSDSVLAMSYLFAVGLAAVFLLAVWRTPEPMGRPRDERRTWLLTLFVLLLLAFWAIAADFLFWLTMLLGALPVVIWLSESAVRHVVRPVGEGDRAGPGLLTAAVQRGIRTVVLLAGLIVLEREIPSAFGIGGNSSKSCRASSRRS